MNFLLHAIPGLSRHLERQHDQKRLLDMPDYLLDDLGVTRAQVIRSARWRLFRGRGR